MNTSAMTFSYWIASLSTLFLFRKANDNIYTYMYNYIFIYLFIFHQFLCMWSLALGHRQSQKRVSSGHKVFFVISSHSPWIWRPAWSSMALDRYLGAPFLIQRPSAGDWVSSRLLKSNQRWVFSKYHKGDIVPRQLLRDDVQKQSGLWAFGK